MSELRILPLTGLPEVREGIDIGALVAGAVPLDAGDVVVLAQKIVSKAEGRVVRLDDIEPSARARELATPEDDPRRLEVILRESRRIVRIRESLVIAETSHGFVCASAGVDASNAGDPGAVVLLPVDPDASARAIRRRLAELTGHTLAVIISDSFGRPWRQGTTDVAIGVAGLTPLLDLRGQLDAGGHELQSTQIAVADELAGAAELVMGKAQAVPGAVIRGFEPVGDGTAQELVMPAERDLFR